MTGVAPDQWPLIEAFRAAGATGFHQLGVAGARAAYEASCARNGLPPRSVALVSDLELEGSPSVAARLYQNSIGGDEPVVLFVHGGGWVMGSLETHDTLCRYIAAKSGSAVLAVDYRLAPEHVYPAALDDVRTAMKWIHTHGHAYGLDPERIVVVGDSAGGHLAADVAGEDTSVKAQVLLYPVTSASTKTPSYDVIVDGFPLTAATMNWFLDLYTDGGAVIEKEVAVRDLTVEPRALPTYICTVGNDPLASGGIQFAKALADAGAYVHEIHLPEHVHGLFTSAGAVPTGEVVLAEACAFVAAAVGSCVSVPAIVGSDGENVRKGMTA